MSLKNKKLRELEKENEELKEKITKDGKKNLEKLIFLLNKKWSILIAWAVKNILSHTGSKAINNKVKLLKTKYLRCEHHKSMFLKQICR